MRWRFTNKVDSAENKARDASIELIENWWNAFQQNTGRFEALFSNKIQFDLPAWMNDHLGAIHPKLMWEFGPAINERGHRLVITPELDRYLRPLTTEILKRAPQIKGWEFYPYRLAEDVGMAIRTVKSRTGLDCSDVNVRVRIGEHHKIDLSFFSREFHDPDQSRSAAFVFAEELLGEECLDKWIQGIDANRPPKQSWLGLPFFQGTKASAGTVSLDRLKPTVDSLINSIRDQLPGDAHWNRFQAALWTIYSREPREDADYLFDSDLITAMTSDTDVWLAAHGPGQFYSECFSRNKETFCYLKMDRSSPDGEMTVAERQKIEDVLNAALIPQKLGCTTGGGTGLRYSYVALALMDLDRAIAGVCKTLTAYGVSKRSWILFYDADFVAEWVGVYDDTPAPLLPSFDEQ